MTNTATYHKENEIAFNDFLADTIGENILQIVLRGHLYIENALEKIIKESFVKPNLLLTEKSMFSNKLSLVSALGIVPHEYTVALKYFNKIRNKFAHDLKFELEEEELIQLINRFDSQTKKIHDLFLKQVRLKGTINAEEFSFKLRTIMASLLTSLNTYHLSYLIKPIKDEIETVDVFAEILNKDKNAQKAYIDDRYNELIKRLRKFMDES